MDFAVGFSSGAILGSSITAIFWCMRWLNTNTYEQKYRATAAQRDALQAKLRNIASMASDN